jgi:hypothetical protein
MSFIEIPLFTGTPTSKFGMQKSLTSQIPDGQQAFLVSGLSGIGMF